jgi:hypothetical protein
MPTITPSAREALVSALVRIGIGELRSTGALPNEETNTEGRRPVSAAPRTATCR